MLDIRNKIASALQNGDSLQIDLLKSFAMGSLRRWIVKGLDETKTDVGQLLSMTIKIRNLNQADEGATILIKGSEKTMPEGDMLAEEVKQVKGFIPQPVFEEPRKKKIKSIQQAAEKAGMEIPTKEAIRQRLYERWKSQNPELKNAVLLFDWQNDKISVTITDILNRTDTKSF